jgi:hypothetical protein
MPAAVHCARGEHQCAGGVFAFVPSRPLPPPHCRSENRASEVRKGWLDNMHYHLSDILSNRNVDNPNPEVVKVLAVGYVLTLPECAVALAAAGRSPTPERTLHGLVIAACDAAPRPPPIPPPPAVFWVCVGQGAHHRFVRQR